MILVQVPTSHGKADLTIYRDASARILTVLASKFTSCIVERASIDEVYLDVSVEAAKWLEHADSETFLASAIETLLEAPSMIAGDDSVEVTMSRRQISKGHSGTDMLASSYNTTDKTNADSEEVQKVTISSWFARPAHMWSTEDKLLLSGALVINELRKAVYDELGFTCSAGIANNKILAKLSSAMHKPNKQTLAPAYVIPHLMKDLPYSRIQGLGGKLGYAIEAIYGDKVRTMGQILALPRAELAAHFGEETAQWLHAVSQGIDHEAVINRALPISIGCSKSFRSTMMLTPAHLADGTVLHWLTELAGELQERLTADTKANSRVARNLHAGASVKIYVNNSTGPGVMEVTNDAAGAPNPDAGGGWEEWHDGRGFSLSKICPLVLSGSTASMARTALQMLTRAIFEHPKYVAAMAGNGAVAYSSNGNTSTNSNNRLSSKTADISTNEDAVGIFPPSPENSRHSAVSAESPALDSKRTLAAPLLWAITGLSMGATNFQTIESGANSIKSYFKMPVNVKADPVGSCELASSATETDLHPADDVQPETADIIPGHASAFVTTTNLSSPPTVNKARAPHIFAKQRDAVGSTTAVKTVVLSSSSKRQYDRSATADAEPKKKPYSIRDTLQQMPRRVVEVEPHGHTQPAASIERAGPAMKSGGKSTAAGDTSSIRHWVARHGGSTASRANSLYIEKRSGPLGHTEVIMLDDSGDDDADGVDQEEGRAEPAMDNNTICDDIQDIEVQHMKDEASDGDTEKQSATGGPLSSSSSLARNTELNVRNSRTGDTGYVPQSMQEIDSAVFLTLPADVQLEIELTMRLRQQTSTNRAVYNKIHTKPATSSTNSCDGATSADKRLPGRNMNQVEPVHRQPESMQDVDSAVFLSLPPDIQREIELTMRLRQQRKAIDSSMFLNDERSSIGKCKR